MIHLPAGIKAIQLLREHTKLRQLQIFFSDGSIVRAEADAVWVTYNYDGTDADERLLSLARPVVEAYTEWLQGGPRPE